MRRQLPDLAMKGWLNYAIEPRVKDRGKKIDFYRGKIRGTKNRTVDFHNLYHLQLSFDVKAAVGVDTAYEVCNEWCRRSQAWFDEWDVVGAGAADYVFDDVFIQQTLEEPPEFILLVNSLKDDASFSARIACLRALRPRRTT